MNINFKKRSLCALMAMAFLNSACVDLGHKQSIENIARNTEQMQKEEINKIISRNDINSPYVKKVNRPFISSKSNNLSYEAALPSVFTKMVLRLPYKRYTISEVADIIQTETGIAIQLAEDIFIDPKDLLKNASGIQTEMTKAKAADSNKATSANQNKNVPADIMPLSAMDSPVDGIVGSSNSLTSLNYSKEMELDHRGSLASLLDKVTARMGLSWEYDGQMIRIQRFVTKTFNIKTHSMELSETTEIGNTSSSSSEEGTKYKSNIGLKTSTKQDPFNDLLEQIYSVLSGKGKAIANQGSMTITVSDNKTSMDKVEQIIRNHNAIMGRQIRMQVQVITFKSNDDRDRGVDLSLIYQTLKDAGATVREVVQLSSPASLVNAATAGLMGVRFTDPKSNWSGSSAIIRALDGIGTTSEKLNRILVTMNNKPAPLSVTRQFSYVSKTTPGTISSTGTVTSSSVGIEQSTDTVGFTMFITPFVTDANNISLKMAINKRVLVRIDTAEAGSGETKQQVQQPVIDGEIHQEYATVRPGETLLISGYEADTDQFDQRNPEGGWTALMGSSYTGSKSRNSTIILITPYLVDGA